MKYLLPVLFLLIALPLQAANTYYVDAVNGNDANNGSSVEEAWKTIAHAYIGGAGSVVEGDTIKLRTGDYGQFSDRLEGTPRSSYTTYIADTAEVPVFSASSGVAVNLNQVGGPFAKYLRFEGITITNAVPMTASQYLVYLDDVNFVQIIDCEIVAAAGSTGVSAGIFVQDISSDIEIDGCTIHSDSEDGGPDDDRGFARALWFDVATDVIITDCNIHNVVTGILGWGHNWLVARNTIFNCTNDGDTFKSIETMTFEDNVIYNIIKVTGGITHNDCLQFASSSSEGDRGIFDTDDVLIQRNIMYNSGDQLLLLRNATTPKFWNTNVINNLFYSGALFEPPNASAAVSFVGESTFSFNNNTVIGRVVVDDGAVGVSFQNNIIDSVDLIDTAGGSEINNENWNIYNTTSLISPHVVGPNNIILEDDDLFGGEFTDFDANDFTLKSDSNAIGRANIIYAPEVDLLGTDRDGSPDAGAYENTELFVESGPPEPNPATWASVPAADGNNAISMIATTATSGASPRSYYFREISGNPGATDSGWQVSDANYTDSGLDGNTAYTYQCQIRGNDACTGVWSNTEDSNGSATAEDTNAPVPNPATFSTPPEIYGSGALTMTATTGSGGGATVEYYFNETTGNSGATASGWQSSPTYIDTGLAHNVSYTYTVQMRDSVPNTGTASSGSSAFARIEGAFRDRWRSGYRKIYRPRYRY